MPLDWISFHFYASCSNRTDVSQYNTFFTQADKFFTEVSRIISIRDSLSPRTKIDIDEIGVILPDDNVQNPIPIPAPYWHAAGAMFAYIVGNLAQVGVDALGESQVIVQASFLTCSPSLSFSLPFFCSLRHYFCSLLDTQPNSLV